MALFGNLSSEQVRKLGDAEYAQLEYKAKLEILNNVSDNHDYTPLISETEDAISKRKILVNEALLYAAAQTELTLANLKMNKAEIVLSEIIKTSGELKSCFRFSYDGRDYKCLSLSEKIKAGMEISELIKRLSGRNYPTFIDNGESVCNLDRPTGQVFISRVVKDQNLQVSYKDNNELRKAG